MCHRVWRREVHGTGEVGRVQCEKDCGNPIVERNPAHPLLAGAERAAQAEPKNGQHAGQRSSAAKDDAGSEVDNTDSGVACRLGGDLPLFAKTRKES